MLTVKMIDYSQQVLETLQGRKHKALDSVGNAVEFYADENVPKDTGRLANSITHYVDDDAVIVGTNVQYGKYVEFGTGIYAENGVGRLTSWRYKDLKGKWHTTKGMKATHFLRRAVTEHLKEYETLFTNELTR